MQSTNFVALAGHLNDYPLPDLIGTLRRKRKSGRLLVEYPVSPCSFYFQDGNLIDAQLGGLAGMQAVTVALSQPNASFNFNPLITAPRQSISESLQKVALELLGCADEKTVEVETTTARQHNAEFSFVPPIDSIYTDTPEPESLPQPKERLALPPSPLERNLRRRNRQALIASAIISLVISLVTAAAFARWIIKREINTAIAEATKNNQLSGSRNDIGGANAQTVKVIVQVDKGRVTQAFVEQPRPGLDSVEALALRIARERRYAKSSSGQDAVLVKINRPQ
ncbi:MAG: DUF4388 domain-containing protein [Pyrinomonadaceae bacterium]